MVQLSIVIITWNQLSYLRDCLCSLQPVMQREDVEVIVVDNGSEDGTCQYLTVNYPQIYLHINDCNKGVAYARNRGLHIFVHTDISPFSLSYYSLIMILW